MNYVTTYIDVDLKCRKDYIAHSSIYYHVLVNTLIYLHGNLSICTIIFREYQPWINTSICHYDRTYVADSNLLAGINLSCFSSIQIVPFNNVSTCWKVITLVDSFLD